jgi:hypothetical protein
MKKQFFPFVCMLMLGFSSCLDSHDNISYYSDMPALIGISYETLQPTVITSLGTFLAPELQEHLYTELYEGDAVWTYFNVNYDQPTASGAHIAYNLSLFKVDTGWAQATVGGESAAGNFNIAIENMQAVDVVNNVVFFIFEHTTVPRDQAMVYELTYDIDATSEPEIYLRAKRDYKEGSESVGTLQHPFAFNMSSFFMKYKDANNMVKFKIKYRAGVDGVGNDRYNNYNQGLPVEIEVK